MIWPFRKASSNGWQRLARGADIPLSAGVKFDVMWSDGDQVVGLIAGKPCLCVSAKGVSMRYTGALDGWSYPLRNGIHATHYRLHRPVEVSAETAARANRENMFRDLLNPTRKIDGVEEPKRAPKREGVDR